MIPYVNVYFLSVPAEPLKVYRHGSLADYSFRERMLIRVAELGLYFVVLVIGNTIRYEVEGWENYEAIVDRSKLPIFSFWHDRIFAGTYYFRRRGIVVMNSKSLDGEYMARWVLRLGYGSVRGSSSRGGTGALVEMIRAMRAGLATAFTLDGPRGPRYLAKKGPVILAKKTGNPLMPFTVECRRFWRLKTWDRIHVPKPFTRARLIIAEPIYVAAGSSDAELDEKLAMLQRSLDKLNERAEEWRKRG